MIDLKSKIEGFSKVYRIETQNYSKIIKVYNQRAFINYFRVNLKKFSKFYSSIQKLKIAPFHRVLSNHILEINEVKCDYPLNNKIFFNNKRLLTQFKEQILLIRQFLHSMNILDQHHSLVLEFHTHCYRLPIFGYWPCIQYFPLT